MSDVTVIKPGMLTTVQDGGRIGYQQYGVTVSGVMDHYAYRMANWLVGNQEKEAVLEVTLLGPTLEINKDMVVAITGGDLGPKLNGQPMAQWTSVALSPGDTLSFAGIRSGCRGIIAFGGGIQVPSLMGSRSTYTRGRMGGLEGRALQPGDTLAIGQASTPASQVLGRKGIPHDFGTTNQGEPLLIRVVPGPQEDAFTEEGLATFYNESYQVSSESDRMGCRLSGPAVAHKKSADIISDGIAMGAIQVPGHGNPIIMMADRQTTGGYTKIANVITVDLPKIAQVKPGESIRFKAVTVEEAQRLIMEEEALFNQLAKQGDDSSLDKARRFVVKVKGKTYHVTLEER
mgnify:CR=1 FL=1